MAHTFQVVFATLALLAQSANAQDGLPPILRTNTLLTGQLYGCVQRLEAYANLTAKQEDSPIKPEEAGRFASMQLGIDISKLKSDLIQSPMFAGKTEEAKKFEELVTKVAEAEFTDKRNIAWAQAASCGQMAHNLGLYDKYPFK